MKHEIWIPGIIALNLLFWAIWTLVFIESFGNPVVAGDSYRHLKKIIIPFLENSSNWRLLWSNHHPSPILHLHQMAVFWFFDGNQLVDARFGLFCQSSIALVLGHQCYRYLKYDLSGNNIVALLGALVTSTAIIAFVTARPYTWPLISIQNHFIVNGLILSLLVWKLHKSFNFTWTILFILMCLYTLFSHASFGLLFVLSAGSVMFFRGVVFRNLQILCIGAATIALAVLFQTQILDFLVLKEKSRPISMELVKQPFSFVAAFGKAIFNALHGYYYENSIPRFVYFLYAVIFIFCGTWATLKKGRIVIASVIIVAITATGLAAAIFRGTENFPHGIASQRYILSYKIGVAAMMWVIFSIISSQIRHLRIKQLIGLGLFVGIAFLSYNSARDIGKYEHLFAFDRNNKELALFMYGDDKDNTFTIDRFVSGGNRKTSAAVNFLRERELNVFSEKYPARKNLSDYILAKQKYETGKIISEFRFNSECISIPNYPVEIIYWKLSILAEKRSSFTISESSTSRKYAILPGRQVHFGNLKHSANNQICFSSIDKTVADLEFYN